MDNKDIKSILQDALEDQMPASQINLLPAVQARLVARNKSLIQQGENRNKTRNRKLVFSAIAIIALLAAALVTPQGRALAQSVLHFFTRAGQDRYPLQSWQMTPPAQLSSQSPFQFSVQEAEARAGYDVLSLAEIPVGMNFMGASYDAKSHMVALAFGFESASIRLSLWQQPLEYYQPCGDISKYCDHMLGSNLIGASAYLETVQIGDVTGDYVEGTWNLTDKGPRWESTPYIKILRWQTDKMIFEVVAGIEFDKDDLVELAASIR